jgi:hypothetical protein
MTALPTATPSTDSLSPTATRSATLGVVRALLLLEAALTLGLAIFLSMLATEARDFFGGSQGTATETTLRFAAAASFIFAIAAAIASRGVRRRRGWAWTTAAVLQLILAVGTGVAVLSAEWHPAYLVGFGLAGLTMLVLCMPAVRRELGQD